MKVLIPTDFSECSLFAFNTVLSQHWPEKTEFTLISIVEPTYAAAAISKGYVQPLVDLHHEHIQSLKQQMKETVSNFRKALPGDYEVAGLVIEGSPAGTIIDEAKELDVDLIIMGSHGRSGIERFLMGSVAEKVTAHAPCSVAIIKNKRVAERSKENLGPRLATA